MRKSIVARPPTPGGRKLAKVPFVELLGERISGCVSSGSDIERVYVCFIERNGAFACSTNNNRPCGGLRADCCKHILEMIDEAILQFGAPAVGAVMDLPPEQAEDSGTLVRGLAGRGGGYQPRAAGETFSRFLGDLRYVELQAPSGPLPEMEWFVG